MRRTAGMLTLSACALGASAFLIPPSVALASNDGPLTHSTLNAKSFALQVACSECAFSPKKEAVKDEAEDDVFWITGGSNAVVLNFTVSEDGERLALNGEDIYPITFLSSSLAKTYVDQVPSTTTWEDIKSGSARTTPLELTGSGVVINSEEVISPQGDVMVNVKHTIFELEKQPVSIDAVSIKLLKTSGGELLIAHVETVERSPPRPNDSFGRPPPLEMGQFEELVDELESAPFPPRPPHHEGPPPERFGPHKECDVLPIALCKLRNAVEAKIHGMKDGMRKGGCHGGKGRPPHMGQMPGHIRPHFMRPDHDDDAPPPRHHGRPHHMRPHGHHRHHHEHSFMHSFSSGFTAVLIPTLAGIAVGMTVSLLGLFVGRLISFLWIKIYRGNRRGYASVALDDSSLEAETEKEVLLKEDEEEALPAYEQAPAYVEVMK